MPLQKHGLAQVEEAEEKGLTAALPCCQQSEPLERDGHKAIAFIQ